MSLSHTRTVLSIADAAFNLIRARATGFSNGSDEWYADPTGENARLFSDDATRDWECGTASNAFMRLVKDQVLAETGLTLQTRMVQWAGAGKWTSHQSAEIYVPHIGWTVYDCYFGAAYNPGMGGLDIFLASQDRRELRRLMRQFNEETPWLARAEQAMGLYPAAVGIVVGTTVPLVLGSGFEVGDLTLDRTPQPMSADSFRQTYYLNTIRVPQP